MGPSEVADELVDLVPVGQEEQSANLVKAGMCPRPDCNGKLYEVSRPDDLIMLECTECTFQTPKLKPTPPDIVGPPKRCTSMCARLRNVEYETPCDADCPGYKPELGKDESITPTGYGELKVGDESMLDGMPVRVRKITKKDIVVRPLNKAIRDKHGMIISKKEAKPKLKLGSMPPV